MEYLEALALENRDKRAEYEKKVDEILARPIPEDEYQKVCKDFPYPIPREAYVTAERAAALLLVGNRLTMHVTFKTRTEPMQANISEAETLQWIADIRRELAAQGQTKGE